MLFSSPSRKIAPGQSLYGPHQLTRVEQKVINTRITQITKRDSSLLATSFTSGDWPLLVPTRENSSDSPYPGNGCVLVCLGVARCIRYYEIVITGVVHTVIVTDLGV